MLGILSKAFRETRLLTLVLGAALLVVTMLLTYVLPKMHEGLNDFLLSMPFVKSILAALTGVSADGGLTVSMLLSILWTHPVVLAIVWGYEIAYCTRMPAGEIDRGTIDVLLGWPVSRRAAYLGESAGLLMGGLFLVGMGLCGYLLSAPAVPEAQRPQLSGILLVAVNLLCVYVAVGGIAYLVSSLSDQRGRALAIVVALVVASFLLNFLANFWEPAKRISFLSVSHYYQPARILGEGALRAGDVIALLAIGGSTWAIGGEITARRNI